MRDELQGAGDGGETFFDIHPVHIVSRTGEFSPGPNQRVLRDATQGGLLGEDDLKEAYGTFVTPSVYTTVQEIDYFTPTVEKELVFDGSSAAARAAAE